MKIIYRYFLYVGVVHKQTRHGWSHAVDLTLLKDNGDYVIEWGKRGGGGQKRHILFNNIIGVNCFSLSCGKY